MVETYVYRENGEVVTLEGNDVWPSYTTALIALERNTGEFEPGERLAVVDFANSSCTFLHVRSVLAIEVDGG